MMLRRKSSTSLTAGKIRESGKLDDAKISKKTSRSSRVSSASVSTESRLHEERDALIHARQNELDQVIDEHDDMVRLFLYFE